MVERGVVSRKEFYYTVSMISVSSEDTQEQNPLGTNLSISSE